MRKEDQMTKILKKIGVYIFHSNTIFIQLLVFTLVVSVVPIILISLLLFNKMSDLVVTTLDKSSSQLVLQYMNDINGSFFRYQDKLQQIANNTIIMDELLGKGDDSNPYIKGDKVSKEVNKSLRLEGYSEYRNCMIYSTVYDSKIYGNNVSMLEEAVKEVWYIDHPEYKGNIFSYLTANRKNKVLSLVQQINYIDTNSFKNSDLGFVKLDLYADKLFEPPKDKENGTYSYDIIVLDESSNLIYESEEQLIRELDEIPFHQLTSNQMTAHNNMLIYKDTVKRYGLDIIFLFDSHVLVDKQEELGRSIIPIILIVIGVIIITAYLFTRSFAFRVEKLVRKIKAVEEGDLTVTEEIGGNDEIALLDKQFNSMVKRLDKLIQKNYIQQLEKKEAELRNLQLQINPHFLYNTLETISAMAAIKGLFNICDLCEKLGEIFRYSLGKNYGEYVTIEQELKHTKNYIFIQEARFGNKFEVDYNVQSELMHAQILRFILQPIVENAIIHGLSNHTRKGKLSISIYEQDGDILIEIEDDGVGMSKERLQGLTEYINDQDKNIKRTTRSIGVKNVNQRIKLSCGNDYGIMIRSELNEGSCFTIRLPFVQ